MLFVESLLMAIVKQVIKTDRPAPAADKDARNKLIVSKYKEKL
jgi:hypothetical protein